MSFLDMFRSRDYNHYLFKENIKLEDQIKALKNENKAVWDQLHEISRAERRPSLSYLLRSVNDENEWLKIENRTLKNTAYQSRPYDYMIYSENDILKQDLKDAKKEIEQLKTELCKRREYKSNRTQGLEYELLKVREENKKFRDKLEEHDTWYCLQADLMKNKKENEGLKTELKIYKDFVTSIMGILDEDKED
jgi:predicted RNase H-like nuclease (RuvC/YqgF family)